MEPLNVLIVEDDPVQGNMLVNVLKNAGFRPAIVDTAGEGYRVAAEIRPALVIIDQHLPDGNGFDLCRSLKAHPDLRGLRVIMVTGTYDKDEIRQRSRELKAEGYLLKPYNIGELLRLAALTPLSPESPG